ncbi:hypothetical protein KRR26_03615 [Corallococcus sp. M34]|uniref:hypothetical protein n=1 Tax=Citreicoccus inhibens TaxID=2849499 RepID=UPI001C21194E|nr:hypothetical protein [Citreicoccus inhibens]MBU8894673.1 hypothetical protein [Citreicoccus inhibens]
MMPRSFSRLPALLLLLLALPATAARTPPPPVADVMAMLRTVESRRVRGKSTVLGLELDDQARARPSDPMPRIYKAWLSFPSDACWNELKAISALYPENPWSFLGMGLIYVKWGLLREAREPLDAVQRLAPDSAPALWGQAVLLQAEGKGRDAEARYRAALEKLDAPQVRAALGLMLAGQSGRAAEAKVELARAVEAWPDQPEALEALVRLGRETQDPRAAAQAGDALVSLRPTDREAHRRQADAWQAVGDREKAVASFERYVALGGAAPEALGALARLDAELGRSAEEEKVLMRLAELAPTDAEPLLRLADLSEARGDAAGSEQWLLKASERAPARADVQVRRARLLEKQERLREALVAYRAALAAPERRVPEAEAEAAALTKRFHLPSTPASGAEDRVYSRVSLGLVALYTERLKEAPDLKGILKVTVRVDEAGHATQVAIVYDTLKDPLLAAHAYFAFLDAQYLPAKAEPVFQYVFRPPK